MQDVDKSADTQADWYQEVPLGERDGEFSQAFEAAQVRMCQRETGQLIVSFSHTPDTNDPEHDWPAWTERFARAKGWSHLAITSDKGSWFRDPDMLEAMKNLRDCGFFERFGNVTFFGAAPQGGGFAALAFAPLCPSARILAFDAQSTLNPKTVPWEKRFDVQKVSLWKGPFQDAAKGLDDIGQAYVVFDPFQKLDRRHIDRLPTNNITLLKGFGLSGEIGIGLKRLGLMDDLLSLAIAGELTPPIFHKMLRSRKTLYLYRRTMEQHLSDRGKPEMIKSFISAFRKLKRIRNKESQRSVRSSSQPATAAQPLPNPLASFSDESFPGAPTAPTMSGRRYPRTLGNVWGLRDDGDYYHYISDQYEGRTMGFSERNEITLGETHPLAIGMASFGHGVGLDRPLPEDFRYHVVDENLFGQIPQFTSKSHGVISQRLAATKNHAYRTIIALSEPQSGISLQEALPESGQYRSLLKRIAAARAALKDWNKNFYLDRISLSLLAAAPETPVGDAIEHYGSVAHSMRRDAAVASGQASFPHIVVSQSAGARTDGRSEVILAEGQLDIALPTLGIIVATPKYPFALMPDMSATPDLSDQILVDELEVLAVAAVQNNQPWYCPSLRQAYARDKTIVVEFSALSDLILEEGFHGFALEGATNAPEITSVEVIGTQVHLAVDKTPEGGDVFVTYAWGASLPKGAASSDNKSANQGSLRDSWSQTSLMRSETTLYRYALSGRLRILPSDLPMTATGSKR